MVKLLKDLNRQSDNFENQLSLVGLQYNLWLEFY